ncbi:MAG TPA: TetR family transcriptional regulator C-terminal domain-containing protein [Polyangiaceae bacterium]|nr:TetR family transcriptional regulator C-terminal domain-containing protein [Polyangiaceae bacterium]
MPRTADPTDIPERLLAAGLDLFLRQGFNGTGIQQIADQAGVPKGSFYNHFASKEAFGAAIVDRYSEYNRRSWKHMMRSAPPEPMAAIRHVFAAMSAYHERASCQSGCLIGNFAAEISLASEQCRERLLAAQLAWRERLAGLIRAGQSIGEIRDDIDPIELSALTWSVWEGALLRMKVEGSATPLHESIALVLDRVYPPTARQPARSATRADRSNV